ncbi:phage baseplate assembly protein V [Aliikangiella maris]|uniref:Phage baseplate assembly protein V n=2 Tax=Aliikangiella maris TaxID=3162458 RepID=A0ABV3MJQ0_9GAMM
MQLSNLMPLHAQDQTQLAEVISVEDPENRNRVQIKLLAFDGVAQQQGQLWARVAVPFAGKNKGAFLFPDVGDEVLITFINGDSRYPVVIGSLWNGRDEAPETLGGAGDAIDRWSFVGKKGTRIAIEESASGQPKIIFATPQGVSVEISDNSGGEIICQSAGNTITFDSAGVTVNSPAEVAVSASTVKVDSGMVTVNAGMSSFSGVVKCDTLIATTVVSSTYTPGAGNVW